MLTLRLSSELEKKLSKIADLLGITKSELARKGIKEYLERMDQINAWEAGKDLFGKYSSGKASLSKNRKALLKQKLRNKRNAKNSN